MSLQIHMKALVVYSSLTGNTKKIGEAVFAGITCDKDIFAVENAPKDFAEYDIIFAGYWVDKGLPDAKAKAFMEGISGKKVATFATLGAYPDSDHAKECVKGGAKILEDNGNTFVDGFICQGKVDPALVERMSKMFPADHPHGMNPERIARLKEAAKHPNAEDEANAKAFAAAVCAKL